MAKIKIATEDEKRNFKKLAFQALKACDVATSFFSWLCIESKVEGFSSRDFAEMCISMGPEFFEKFPDYCEPKVVQGFKTQVDEAIKAANIPEDFFGWVSIDLKMRELEERVRAEVYVCIGKKCCESYKEYFNSKK